MNASANISERGGELKWEKGNWGHATIAEPHNSRPSPPNQVDWDWNNSMILSHPSGGGSTDDDAVAKSSVPESASSHLRPFSGILSSGFPSNFSQNPVGIFCSSGITSFRDISIASVTPRPVFHDTLSSPNVTGIPGLAPTKGGNGDLRHPFEFGRGQYFGLMDPDQKWLTTDLSIKREMDASGSDGHGSRLGLNLGVRTYFSTEDTGVGRLGKRHRANSPGSQVPMCQAEGCRADLSTAKHYHRRHKVCEIHSKASDVIAAGQTQRFCQQCSRFHILSEFDEGKRSCRKRLADHNRRRRKPQQIVPTGKATLLEPATQKVDEKNNRISASTGQTSIFIQLQQSGSPSSVSMGDSDDKTTSVGNVGVQLLASNGFDQQVMVLNSHGSPGPTPSSRSMLQGIGIHPGVPFMFQNVPPQLSVLSGGTQERTLYQQYFGGVVAQSGTSLSLSSVAEAPHGIQRKLSEKSCAASEPFVPWSRSIAPGHDVMQADHRPLMHLQLQQLTQKKVEVDAQQEINGDHSAAVQVFSGSIQNALPNVNRSRWIASEQTSPSSFDSFGSNVYSVGEQISGLHCSRLGKAAETPQVDEEDHADEFLGHRGSQRLDSSARKSGSDMKFLEMQGLGPGSFGPTFL